MSNLVLIKSEDFGKIKCDFYKNEKKDILMTREQIGQALEYSDPIRAISKLHERHEERLSKFSVVVKLTTTDGKAYNTTVYTAKGIYEICRWSHQPKADAFMDWVWNVVEDIRKYGLYAVDELINNPDLAIKAFTALKEEKEKNKALELANKQKDQIIGKLKPKANYTDLILKNLGLVTITQIAQDYGMSGQKMNEVLHDLKVQYKQSGQWLVYSQYKGKGYTGSETVNITHNDGRADVKMNTKWTQKGRLFLYDLLKENGILPIIEQNMKEQAV